jgi:hypothetical protein
MTFKPKQFCVFLLITFPCFIFAQSLYYPGYVLKNSGDTLKGFIKYAESTKSPNLIDFKSNKDDKQVQQFDPQAIKRFQINGIETCITYSGFISMGRTSRFSLSDVPTSLDTGKKPDVIFLKQLVTGKYLTLFSYTDDIKTRFFVAERNGVPAELEFYEFYNEQRQIVTLDGYKNQLTYMVTKFHPENNELINKVQLTNYEQFGIMSLVSEIDNSNPITINERIYIRFIAGLAINSTKTDLDAFNTKPSAAGTSPKISIGIDLFSKTTLRRLVFRTELSYSYVNAQYSYPASSNDLNVALLYTLNQRIYTVTPQFLVNICNTPNLKLYIDGGIAFNFSTYANNKFIPQAVPNNNNTVSNPTFAPSWNSFPAQAGIVFNKKIEIYFFYNNDNFSIPQRFLSKTQSLGLGIKFLFGRN